MLNKSALDIIEKYVNDTYYDREKLISYLNMHSVVGNEIFTYCDKNKRQGRARPEAHSKWLDDGYGYNPLPIDDFIKRIPFYFYVDDGSFEFMGNLDYFIGAGIPFSDKRYHDGELESLYLTLEYMFYEKNISLVDIFNYPRKQSIRGDVLEKLRQWEHYLHLCDNLKTAYPATPECFLISYNEVLEKNGLNPIIYELDALLPGEYFWRDGSKITLEGTFPCDREGNPILKWIGVRIKNAKSIACIHEEPGLISNRMRVELAPDTIIYGLNCYNNADEGDIWYQLYAGPLTMQFDYEVLKYKRKSLKYTQREVADAVGATVRTYQKWENGETTPDGHYLLRLMNWLNILSVQDLIKYAD